MNKIKTQINDEIATEFGFFNENLDYSPIEEGHFKRRYTGYDMDTDEAIFSLNETGVSVYSKKIHRSMFLKLEGGDFEVVVPKDLKLKKSWSGDSFTYFKSVKRGV